MTFLRPGQHPDELISDSLTGDLTDDERALLDAHLATCPACRDTLAAFSEQRRLISGMRHQSPPRDLAARVRGGIESRRFAPRSWWRRPGPLVGIGASLAAVAAGVLAVVVLTNLRLPQVGQTSSPASSPSTPATASLDATPAATPSVTPPAPVAADPNPVGALVYTVDIAVPDTRLEMVTAGARQEIPLARYGTPTEATLSPDGDWVAFTLLGEGTGFVDAFVYRISDGSLVQLVDQGLDSPFLRFAWSPGGHVLAYTVLGQDASADAWLFYPASGTTRQLTQSGAAFAASFEPGSQTSAWLWLSVAAEGQATSYRVSVPLDSSEGSPIDPAESPDKTSVGAFLPMLNPLDPASWAAVWRGEMARDDLGWHFVRGGMLHMVPAIDGSFDLGAGGQQVFSTLSIQPNGAAFTSARFEWAPDGDGFAVWDAQWTGTEEGSGFPDPQRVYFGHVGDGSGELITKAQALDAADTQGALDVVDVALGGGQYLALTLRMDSYQGNEYLPTANLILVTRQLGATPDEVRAYGSEGVWNGPALYPASLEPAP
jgi:putative zinc finger protein